MFARDIRGEGWAGRRDCSRNVATICRFAPDEGTGATYYERLRAAESFIQEVTRTALTVERVVHAEDSERQACVDRMEAWAVAMDGAMPACTCGHHRSRYREEG